MRSHLPGSYLLGHLIQLTDRGKNKMKSINSDVIVHGGKWWDRKRNLESFWNEDIVYLLDT